MNSLNQRDQNSKLINGTPQQYGHFQDYPNPNNQAQLAAAEAILRERYSKDYQCYHWLLVFFIICDLAFVTNLMIRLDHADLKNVVGLVLNGIQLVILAYAMIAKNNLDVEQVSNVDRLLNGMLYIVIFYYAFLIFGLILDGGYDVVLKIVPVMALFVIHFVLMFYFYRKNAELRANLVQDMMIRMGHPMAPMSNV